MKPTEIIEKVNFDSGKILTLNNQVRILHFEDNTIIENKFYSTNACLFLERIQPKISNYMPSLEDLSCFKRSFEWDDQEMDAIHRVSKTFAALMMRPDRIEYLPTDYVKEYSDKSQKKIFATVMLAYVTVIMRYVRTFGKMDNLIIYGKYIDENLREQIEEFNTPTGNEIPFFKKMIIL